MILILKLFDLWTAVLVECHNVHFGFWRANVIIFISWTSSSWSSSFSSCSTSSTCVIFLVVHNQYILQLVYIIHMIIIIMFFFISLSFIMVIFFTIFIITIFRLFFKISYNIHHPHLLFIYFLHIVTILFEHINAAAIIILLFLRATNIMYPLEIIFVS